MVESGEERADTEEDVGERWGVDYEWLFGGKADGRGEFGGLVETRWLGMVFVDAVDKWDSWLVD